MFTYEQINRFWSNVDICNPHSCWDWKLVVDHDGYGKVSIKHKVFIAHRVAYEIIHGEFDKSKHVLHYCDNPRCCNPDHLHLGTHSENMQEMILHGRRKTIGYTKNKMTQEKADQLRLEHKNGKPKRQLSREYGISPRSVREIISGLYWNR